MGGSGGGILGGGSSYGGADKLSKLEDVAREELKKTQPAERRKVFISFRNEDKGLVEYLRGQAKNTNSDLDLIDVSLRVPFDSKNADYIRQGIRARIKQCSVTTVMMTDSTHESKWVNWEIRESMKLGKGVVVIDKRKNSKSKMPAAISENKSKVKIVSWKHEDIMNAVNTVAKNK